jgi:hypothetical protein
MQETGSKISLRHFIQDDSFRTEQSAAYNLFILIDDFQLSCAVASHGDHVFLGLEDWTLKSQLKSITIDDLDACMHASNYLQHDGYRNVVCCIATGNPVFVPNALFDERSAFEHLKFTSGEQSLNSEFIDHLRRMDASAVFSVPSHLVKYLKSKFSNIVFHHAATPMVEYLLSSGKTGFGNRITVSIANERAGIFVTNGKNLELCNYFSFESAEELVYYLVFICEQLHLNPDSAEVIFTGEIDSSSPAFNLASKYIRQVSIADRPGVCIFSDVFKEIPEGRHFNLFTQAVCVS